MALSEEQRQALGAPGVMDRYWAKVDKNGPLWRGTPCWMWKAGTSKAGYGQVRLRIGRRFVALYAHRIALLIIGRLPDGLEACHGCNTPRCVNPDHIYPGTHKQNMQQARADGLMRKPRVRSGEAHHSSRNSDAQIREMREQRAAGARLVDLAATWGYDFSTVSDICRGKTRRDAGGPLTRFDAHERKVVVKSGS